MWTKRINIVKLVKCTISSILNMLCHSILRISMRLKLYIATSNKLQERDQRRVIVLLEWDLISTMMYYCNFVIFWACNGSLNEVLKRSYIVFGVWISSKEISHSFLDLDCNVVNLHLYNEDYCRDRFIVFMNDCDCIEWPFEIVKALLNLYLCIYLVIGKDYFEDL